MVARLPIRGLALKAGSAGSSPDGAANPGALQPLRDFLVTVGEAVANLNTTVVGLDAVERGHEKPETLSISWNPHDRVTAARKARRFVVEAVLVRVAEALSEFISATAQLPRFRPLRTRWNNNTSLAEKLADVATTVLGDQNSLAAGAALLIHWRNRVVHPRSRASLTPRQIQTLQDASEEIEEEFAGLSVARLLSDFEAGTPTLKDISSLIAMSIKMARRTSEKVDISSEEDLDALLEYYGLKSRIAGLVAQTTPAKRDASVLRLLQSAVPGLAEPYRRLRTSSG